MYALTIWQPWAWAIVAGHKDVENRDWRPRPSLIGQTIAIHAGKRIDDEAISVVEELCGEQPKIVTGAIIGTARLLQVVASHPSVWRSQSNFGFVLGEARPLSTPLPCAGALNFWRVPESLASHLEAAA